MTRSFRSCHAVAFLLPAIAEACTRATPTENEAPPELPVEQPALVVVPTEFPADLFVRGPTISSQTPTTWPPAEVFEKIWQRHTELGHAYQLAHGSFTVLPTLTREDAASAPPPRSTRELLLIIKQLESGTLVFGALAYLGSPEDNSQGISLPARQPGF